MSLGVGLLYSINLTEEEKVEINKQVRKDKETSKSFYKLEEQLKNGEFHAGRGAEKLPGLC